MNYFELFELKPQLEIDARALKKRYYRLSKEAHPDYYTQSDSSTQEEKIDESSQLNDAYKTLKNQESRIRYILTENGLLGEGEQKVPQEFLMEMMEINEALMELEMGGSEDEYASAMAKVEAFENQLMQQLNQIKEQWNEEHIDPCLEDLKDYYLKNRYLLRMKENLSKFADR